MQQTLNIRLLANNLEIQFKNYYDFKFEGCKTYLKDAGRKFVPYSYDKITLWDGSDGKF